MDQRPVQAGKTTACSVATSVDSVKDPTPNSFQGIDLADKEIHNQVEDKIDSRVDRKAVDTGLEAHIGLEAHTDTGASALEVHMNIALGVDIDKKVDLGVHRNTGVDPGVHIGPGVDLEEGIVP